MKLHDFAFPDGQPQTANQTTRQDGRSFLHSPAIKFLSRPDLFNLLQNNAVSSSCAIASHTVVLGVLSSERLLLGGGCERNLIFIVFCFPACACRLQQKHYTETHDKQSQTGPTNLREVHAQSGPGGFSQLVCRHQQWVASWMGNEVWQVEQGKCCQNLQYHFRFSFTAKYPGTMASCFIWFSTNSHFWFFLSLQPFFIDHGSRATSFIDPRLPIDSQAFQANVLSHRPPARQRSHSAGEDEIRFTHRIPPRQESLRDSNVPTGTVKVFLTGLCSKSKCLVDLTSRWQGSHSHRVWKTWIFVNTVGKCQRKLFQEKCLNFELGSSGWHS